MEGLETMPAFIRETMVSAADVDSARRAPFNAHPAGGKSRRQRYLLVRDSLAARPERCSENLISRGSRGCRRPIRSWPFQFHHVALWIMDVHRRTFPVSS